MCVCVCMIEREERIENSMRCSILYLCTALQCIFHSVIDKNSLRNHLKISGSKFGKAEATREATSAIEAENNEGLEKAAALCGKELHWLNVLPYHFYSCVGFCRTLNK